MPAFTPSPSLNLSPEPYKAINLNLALPKPYWKASGPRCLLALLAEEFELEATGAYDVSSKLRSWGSELYRGWDPGLRDGVAQGPYVYELNTTKFGTTICKQTLLWAFWDPKP